MTVYDRGGEKLVIMDVREALVQTFDAPEWTDLRVGFMVSITSSLANDNISSLSENIVDNGAGIPITDRFFIGVKDASDNFPGAPGTQFIGFTNLKSDVVHTKGDSKIVVSDNAINTAANGYYLPLNGDGIGYTFSVYDGSARRAQSIDGSQIHFIQNNATTYATCIAFRLTRRDTRSNARQVTVQIKKTAGGHNGDLLYSNNPSADTLQAQLANFPTTVQQFGPISLSEVPDTLFLYTPWHGSRLRIHAMGIYSVQT